MRIIELVILLDNTSEYNELSQNPSERTSVHQIMKYSKEEFDRLMETSPPILDKVIKQFKKFLKMLNLFVQIFVMNYQPQEM